VVHRENEVRLGEEGSPGGDDWEVVSPHKSGDGRLDEGVRLQDPVRSIAKPIEGLEPDAEDGDDSWDEARQVA